MTAQILSRGPDRRFPVAGVALVLTFVLSVPRPVAGQVEVGASTFVCVDTSNRCDDTPSGAGSVSPDPTVPFSDNKTFVTPDFSLSYLSQLQSGFGVYRSATTATYDGTLRSFVSAQALSLEQLTISAPGLGGSPGFLEITWTIDGVMTSSGAGQASLFLQDCFVPVGTITLFGPPSGAGAGCQFRTFNSSAPAVFTYPLLFSFTFGEPFSWRARFVPSSNFAGPGAATSDFFNTIVLSGLHVFTPNLMEVSNPTFTSGSGAEYSTGGVITVLTVTIDIKPGDFPNIINLGSAGVLPVAILSTPTFDATQVNPQSITLAGASVRLIGKGNRYSCAPQDVNGDNVLDLVCHIETAQFFLEPGDSTAVFEATTFGGKAIQGQDSIRIVQD